MHKQKKAWMEKWMKEQAEREEPDFLEPEVEQATGRESRTQNLRQLEPIAVGKNQPRHYMTRGAHKNGRMSPTEEIKLLAAEEPCSSRRLNSPPPSLPSFDHSGQSHLSKSRKSSKFKDVRPVWPRKGSSKEKSTARKKKSWIPLSISEKTSVKKQKKEYPRLEGSINLTEVVTAMMAQEKDRYKLINEEHQRARALRLKEDKDLTQEEKDLLEKLRIRNFSGKRNRGGAPSLCKNKICPSMATLQAVTPREDCEEGTNQEEPPLLHLMVMTPHQENQIRLFGEQLAEIKRNFLGIAPNSTPIIPSQKKEEKHQISGSCRGKKKLKVVTPSESGTHAETNAKELPVLPLMAASVAPVSPQKETREQRFKSREMRLQLAKKSQVISRPPVSRLFDASRLNFQTYNCLAEKRREKTTTTVEEWYLALTKALGAHAQLVPAVQDGKNKGGRPLKRFRGRCNHQNNKLRIEANTARKEANEIKRRQLPTLCRVMDRVKLVGDEAHMPLDRSTAVSMDGSELSFGIVCDVAETVCNMVTLFDHLETENAGDAAHPTE